MKASSFGDAVWSGVNSLVENQYMSSSIDCIRGIITNDDSKKNSSILLDCGRNTLVIIINNKLFPKTGKYANLLANQFRKYPKVTIAKLRKWGITSDMIYETAKGFLSDTEIKAINAILNNNSSNE